MESKKKLQDLLDTFDGVGEIKAVSKNKLELTVAGKTFSRDISDDAGLSQAVQELRDESQKHVFLTSWQPSEEASNKSDGKKGLKADEKAKKKE